MNFAKASSGVGPHVAWRTLATMVLASLVQGEAMQAGTGVVDPSSSGSREVAPLLVPFYSNNRLAVVFPFSPPPMRLAKEHPSARNPPLLPAKEEKKPDTAPTPNPGPETGVEASSASLDASLSVSVGNPISEAIDFFRSVARQPEAANVAEGVVFDPEFRPALPPPQPVSQATYQVE